MIFKNFSALSRTMVFVLGVGVGFLEEICEAGEHEIKPYAFIGMFYTGIG
jgi:hypothetical protein